MSVAVEAAIVAVMADRVAGLVDDVLTWYGAPRDETTAVPRMKLCRKSATRPPNRRSLARRRAAHAILQGLGGTCTE